MTLTGGRMSRYPLRWQPELLANGPALSKRDSCMTDPSTEDSLWIAGSYSPCRCLGHSNVWSKKGNKSVEALDQVDSVDRDGDPVRRCSGLLKILSRFAERTSMQGVPNIRASTSTAGKLAWTSLFFVCLCLLSGHLYYLCYIYYSYPKHSVLELGFSALSFPAVTFCNVNPVKKSRLADTSEQLQTLVSLTHPGQIAKKMQMAAENETIQVGRERSIQQPESTTQEAAAPAAWNITDASGSGPPSASENVRRQKRHRPRGEHQGRAKGTFRTDDGESVVRNSRSMTDLADRRSRQQNASNWSGSPGLPDNRSRSIGAVRATTLSGNQQASDQGSRTVSPVVAPPAPSRQAELSALNDTAITTHLPRNAFGKADNSSAQNTSTGKTRSDLEASHPQHAAHAQVHPKHRSFINHLDLGLDLTKMKTMQRVQQQEAGAEGQPWLRQVFTEPSVAANIREEFIHLYSSMHSATRAELGHQVEDMLVDCSFAGQQCHPENFTQLSSFVFGNCFTIDPPGMIATSSGYRGGLSLTVFLESDEYLRSMTTGTGIHVVIHPHSTMPFPQENGLAVMAGTETNIALKLLNINRLGYPHGDCQDGKEFREKFHVEYTRRACQHYCEQSAIIERCGCFNEQGGENIQMSVNSHLNACTSESDFRCMLATQRQFERGRVPCNCANPCNEKDYVKTLSMRHWPADEYTPVLVEALCSQRNATECKKYRRADLRTIGQSFVKLNIFYEDLNYENITEVEDYELPQFASDVGGTVGLWVGLSILSGFEIVQFLLELVTYVFRLRCWRHSHGLHSARSMSSNESREQCCARRTRGSRPLTPRPPFSGY